MMETVDIEAEAMAELKAEDHRARVEAATAQIRKRRGRSLLQRIFPFRIRFEWLD